jgi:hypothetical protein
MAVQNYTVTALPASNTWLVTWGTAGDSDTFTPFPMTGGFAKRTAQVEGTFGGATITINGSVDGTNYEALTTEAGAACTFAGKGVKSVGELTQYIKPTTASGSGSSLTVSLLIHGTI